MEIINSYLALIPAPLSVIFGMIGAVALVASLKIPNQNKWVGGGLSCISVLGIVGFLPLMSSMFVGA